MVSGGPREVPRCASCPGAPRSSRPARGHDDAALQHDTRGAEDVRLAAWRVRAALQMQLNKTDENDAEGLAQIMRTGWYRAVHVKSLDAHRARALLGARAQLVGMTTRLSNMIRGVLKTFGLLPGTGRGLRFDRKVEALLE